MKKFRYDMPSAVMRIFVGLILTGFGIYVISSASAQKSRCSEEVIGTVVRIEQAQIRRRTNYRPVIEYEYKGQEYTFFGYYNRYSSDKVGQTRKLRIDPNDPSDAYDSEKSIWYAYIILAAGAGMLIFGICTVKKQRQGTF